MLGCNTVDFQSQASGSLARSELALPVRYWGAQKLAFRQADLALNDVERF
jgi:hypothetical protein